jgi:hypothetical protein
MKDEQTLNSQNQRFQECIMALIERAVDITLDTTEKGHRLLEKQEEEDWVNATDPRIDFLIAVEEDYFCVGGGIDDIYESCQKYYKDIYGVESSLTQEDLVGLFADGLIKIRKTIWTNSDIVKNMESEIL